MGQGAWDYAANTCGYTMGLVLQAVYHHWAIRIAHVAVPTEANGANMQYKGLDASSSVLEIENTAFFKKNNNQFSTIRAGWYLNKANMGSYTKVTFAEGSIPDITQTREIGRAKWGWYMGLDNHFIHLHHFVKTSWNDGGTETWAFTEIDRSIATGFLIDGNCWKRSQDHLGIAYVNNGLSEAHKNYLQKGGYGFIIGDGALNYSYEQILETFYSLQLYGNIFISHDYQFVLHPAYNKDRGPVSFVACRIHVDL